MRILYVEKTFKHCIDVYKKGTFILMANYRERWWLGKYPVIHVASFQMLWGARPCVLNMTREEMIAWIKEAKPNLEIIDNFLYFHEDRDLRGKT